MDYREDKCDIVLEIERLGPIRSPCQILIRPLTVLIGPSNTGKSLVLKVLYAHLSQLLEKVGAVYREAILYPPSTFSERVASEHVREKLENDKEFKELVKSYLIENSEIALMKILEKCEHISREFLANWIRGLIVKGLGEVFRYKPPEMKVRLHLADMLTIETFYTNEDKEPSVKINFHDTIVCKYLKISKEPIGVWEYACKMGVKCGAYSYFFDGLISWSSCLPLSDPIKDFSINAAACLESFLIRLMFKSGLVVSERLEKSDTNSLLERVVNSRPRRMLYLFAPRSLIVRALNEPREPRDRLVLRFLELIYTKPETCTRLVQDSTLEFLKNLISGEIEFREAHAFSEPRLIYKFRYKYENREVLVDVPVIDASASVNELSLLYLLIDRCCIDYGDVLLIEEPETELHPSYQVKISRLITRLINSGVYVILTTHSDYILRELTLLARLATLDPSTRRKLIEEHGLDVDPHIETLDPRKVALYVFRHDGKVEDKSSEFVDIGYSVDIPYITEVVNKMLEEAYIIEEERLKAYESE